MATAYRVTVFRDRIVSLIQVGDGDRWTHKKAKQIEMRARAIAPRRTGRLSASHVTLPTIGSNQYAKRYRVSAQAYYAQWVHGGTGIYGPLRRPITAPNGWMKIPGKNPSPNRVVGRHGTVVESHRGQRPKPWLERAALEVL